MKRQRHYSSDRKNVVAKVPKVIPGVTRTAGAYQRAANYYEKKYLDTDGFTTPTTLSTTGTVIDSLVHIPQDSTDTARIGNRCNLRNINVTVRIQSPPQLSTGAHDSWHRIILFIDHQCNGAAAAVTDVLTAASVQSHRNMNQLDRFTIIKDKIVVLNPQAYSSTTAAPVHRVFKMSWKGNLPLYYSGTSGAIAQIKSNNVGLLFIASDIADNPVAQYQSRVKFTET